MTPEEGAALVQRMNEAHREIRSALRQIPEQLGANDGDQAAQAAHVAVKLDIAVRAIYDLLGAHEELLTDFTRRLYPPPSDDQGPTG